MGMPSGRSAGETGSLRRSTQILQIQITRAGYLPSGLFPLSGPNNPVGNFFASQINRSDGTLDTSDTFGTRNAVASSGVNTVACRQGWDVTAIDVSSLLAVDQTTAVIRLTTDGDLYVVNTLGLQVDSNGAQIDVTKSADKTIASDGEENRYKRRLINPGNLRAETVSLSDSLPAERSGAGRKRQCRF